MRRPPVTVVVAVVAALVVSMFGSTIVASPPSGAATAAGPSTYVPVQQTRVYDSGGQVAGGGVVAVPITGGYGVPSTGTTSVLVSITVLGSSGNVVAYPADEAAPGVANVQKVANQAVNNAAIVRVSTAASGGTPGGSIDVLNQGDGPGSSSTCSVISRTPRPAAVSRRSTRSGWSTPATAPVLPRGRCSPGRRWWSTRPARSRRARRPSW